MKLIEAGAAHKPNSNAPNTHSSSSLSKFFIKPLLVAGAFIAINAAASNFIGCSSTPKELHLKVGESQTVEGTKIELKRTQFVFPGNYQGPDPPNSGYYVPILEVTKDGKKEEVRNLGAIKFNGKYYALTSCNSSSAKFEINE